MKKQKTDRQFNPGAGSSAAFDETNWWVVRKAGHLESPQAEDARANLCRTYWRPIYCYVRGLGHRHEDAQDLTQEFFARLLEKNYVVAARREKGRFRSFLLTMLKRFLADQWDYSHRQKRGGGDTPISINSGDTAFQRRCEPTDDLTPDKLFDRAWAESLLELALDRLAEESTAEGQKTMFQELRSFIAGDSEVTYAEEARTLGLTVGNLKVIVHRLRQRYRELLRDEIARTARSPEEVEEEIHSLHAALREALH